MSDDLQGQLGAGFVGVQTGPAVVAAGTTATTSPTANGAYDGTGANPGLLNGVSGVLDPGQQVTVTVTVTLGNSTVQPVANTASGGGGPPSGPATTTTGSASVALPQNPAVTLAKSAGAPVATATPGQYQETYTLVLTNSGNVRLTSLTMSDDLQGQLGAAFVGVQTGPAVVAAGTTATTSPTANAAYDGTAVNPGLLDGTSGVLDPGQQVTVTFTVRHGNSTPQPLTNTASGGGSPPSGAATSSTGSTSVTLPQ